MLGEKNPKSGHTLKHAKEDLWYLMFHGCKTRGVIERIDR